MSHDCTDSTPICDFLPPQHSHPTRYQGYFELIVKTYEYGKMSSHMNKMTIGDSVSAI